MYLSFPTIYTKTWNNEVTEKGKKKGKGKNDDKYKKISRDQTCHSAASTPFNVIHSQVTSHTICRDICVVACEGQVNCRMSNIIFLFFFLFPNIKVNY